MLSAGSARASVLCVPSGGGVVRVPQMAALMAQKQSPVMVEPQATLCWRHLSPAVRTAEEPRKRVLWPHVAFATPLSLNGNLGGNSSVEVAMLFKPEAGMLDRRLSWV